MNDFEVQQAEGHIKVLKICHYVYAGLTLLGLGFLVLHYFMMNTFMRMAPEATSGPNGGAEAVPDFDQVMGIMIWFYVLMGVSFLVIGGLNLMSASFMGKRTNKTFSIVVGGLNCVNIPLGTVLGVFTILTLLKPAARVLYGETTLSNEST